MSLSIRNDSLSSEDVYQEIIYDDDVVIGMTGVQILILMGICIVISHLQLPTH